MSAQPIACTLTGGDLTDRRARWRRFGETASVGVVETPTGLRLVFRASPAAEQELRELAELERDCCAFATWTVTNGGSHLVLDVDAEGEGITALHAMFPDLRATLAEAW